MMSTKSKRELVRTVSPRYVTAIGAEKARILQEFVAITGYHRKYALALLNHPPLPRCRPITRSRAKTYTPAVGRALVSLWQVAGCICAKRLVPFLPDLVAAMECHNELVLESETRHLLLTLSIATADRLLAEVRRVHPPARSLTKGGTVLRQHIPIRTFADWEHVRPGFCEVDLVAHSGESGAGEFVHTLTLTDVVTGWTECVAVTNKGEAAVREAIITARAHLPFPLLGLDSDNGGEFINHHLYRYCQREEITFTRCRPYRKNDQCRVEQKNGHIVRQLVGYERYEGREACETLNALYAVAREVVNYFQPSVRLVGKARVGSRVKKTYDAAQTPYRRVLAAETVCREDKDRLRVAYAPLRPVALRRVLEERQEAVWRGAVVRNTREATTRPK